MGTEKADEIQDVLEECEPDRSLSPQERAETILDTLGKRLLLISLALKDDWEEYGGFETDIQETAYDLVRLSIGDVEFVRFALKDMRGSADQATRESKTAHEAESG
jgi:uncharacterized protein YbjT (DUF2867 family)